MRYAALTKSRIAVFTLAVAVVLTGFSQGVRAEPTRGALVELSAVTNPTSRDRAVPKEWVNTGGSLGGSYSTEPKVMAVSGNPPVRYVSVPGGVSFYSTASGLGTGSFGRNKIESYGGTGPTGNEPSLRLTDFTIEVWLRRRGDGDQDHDILGLWDSASGERCFLQLNADHDADGNSLDIRMQGAGTASDAQVLDVLAIPKRTDGDDFDHLVVTWDNSAHQAKVYFNNGSPSTHSLSATFTRAPLTHSSFFKTNSQSPEERRFNGDIATVRIYDSVLTAQQIAANFAFGPEVPAPATTAPPAAKGVRLTHGETVYEIDRATGSVRRATDADRPFIAPSHDHYTLLLRTSDVNADESSDRVHKRTTSADGTELIFECLNEKLGITIRKTYRIEQQTGWLIKQMTYAATEGVDGLLMVESGWSVPDDWWRSSILWQPRWHTAASPFYRTKDIKGFVNLAPTNGCRTVFTLYKPTWEQTLVHWRWGSDEFEFFESFLETGDNLSRLPVRGKRVWPRRWLLGAGTGFVTSSTGESFTSTMIYGVAKMRPLQFYLDYAKRDEFRRLLTEPAEEAPPWMADTVIDDAIDYTMFPAYNGIARQFLEHKHPFGYVQAVWWRPYSKEFYAATPDQVEEISGEDPKHIKRFIAEMKALHPHYRIGPYTHYVQSGAFPGSRLAKTAWEKGWVTMRRDGMRVRYGADEAPGPYGMLPLRLNVPAYRKRLITRWTEILDHVDPDFINCDSTPHSPGRREMDWRTMTMPQPKYMQRLWVDLLRIATSKGKGIHMNFPVPMGNSCGYSEFPWWQLYQNDWRLTSTRLALQKTMSPATWRLYLVGYVHRTGHISDDSVRTNLNYMTLLAMGFSLLELKNPSLKEPFYTESPPYLQAAWEIRNRAIVDAIVQPNVMALEGETEAYAWRALDGYGLVTALNHDVDAADQRILLTTQPLGLRPGKPALLWRLEMADPREVDFSKVTLTSPVRRLAQQKLLRVVPSLSKQLDMTLDLPSENPVAVLLSPSPAAIVSVDDRLCQYWLPAAHGVQTSGSWNPETGLANIMVNNPNEKAELIVLASGGQTMTITQRRWGKSHGAGVAPGAESIDHTFIKIDGQTFAHVKVGNGATEIILEP